MRSVHFREIDCSQSVHSPAAGSPPLITPLFCRHFHIWHGLCINTKADKVFLAWKVVVHVLYLQFIKTNSTLFNGFI